MKNAAGPIVLPARMSLKPSAFADMEIAVFDFPYTEAFAEFTTRLARILRKERLDWWDHPPYRLLNSALVACAPTIVHGFEKDKKQRQPPRRALAVGRLKRDASGLVVGSTLECPSEKQVATLIRLWTHLWGQQSLKKLIEGEAKGAWEDLQEAVSGPPQTQWRRISPAALLADLYAEQGLAFSAIPSLLATLLHGEKATLGKQGREVRWRRAQDAPNRLCVVSDPQDIAFLRESRYAKKPCTGFFAYKLEFQVQTQAGRTEPWIHVFLRCQRYAHQALTQNPRRTDVTVMVGMNQARMEGWNTDTTLVRLKANKHVFSGRYASPEWSESLPLLLSEFGARPLSTPSDVYANPLGFWDRAGADEYYVVHTEGFKYGKYRSNHSVMTGFGLAEHSEVIEKACCGTLKGALEPDAHFVPDAAAFGPKDLPRVLWNISDLSKRPDLLGQEAAKKRGWTEEERQEQRAAADRERRALLQSVPAEALVRALHGSPLVIALMYRNDETRDALFQQIRQAFLLNDGDPLPPNVIVLDRPILDEKLLAPLDVGELSAATRHQNPGQWEAGFSDAWEGQMRKSRSQKIQGWRTLLQEAFGDVSPGSTACLAALIETPEDPEPDKKSEKTFHDSQNIKGTVREACVRSKVLSQMLHPVEMETDRKTGARVLPAAEKGRAQNAVQEIVTRQIGALYGAPADAYVGLGLPSPLAAQLDVLAFCLRTTNSGVSYALAVRLRNSGEMDVLLPEAQPQWRPYAQAGPVVGRLFAEARKDVRAGKVSDGSAIRLSQAALCDFVEKTLLERLERPTVAVIEAENWRQEWSQLTNPRMAALLGQLTFGNKWRGGERVYQRDDPRLDNLVSVVRLRTGGESPQYTTGRETWQNDDLACPSRDLFQLSGFVDQTTQAVFHYFSIGRLPDTVKRPQSTKGQQDPYKIEDGGGFAFKHQQMVEMVPFFVRPDFQTEEGQKALCRVPHYLRSSPAWTMGNITLPYPMHLGEKLIEDQLCILGLDT